MMPYTARLPTAEDEQDPMSMFGLMMNRSHGRRISGIDSTGPNGTTARASIVVGAESRYAAGSSRLVDVRRDPTSSLRMNFSPSAIGWKSPIGPTRLGPIGPA